MFSFQTEQHHKDAGKVGGVLNSLIMDFFALAALMNFYPFAIPVKMEVELSFLSLCLGPHHTVLRNYSWLCVRVAPGQIQGTLGSFRF